MKHYHFTDNEKIMRLNVPAETYEEALAWIKMEMPDVEVTLIGVSTNFKEYCDYNKTKRAFPEMHL